MMKELLIRWLGILLFIAISILLIRLFIWLLPIIFLLIIGYYIYNYIKEVTKKDVEIEKNKKRKHTKNNKNKKIVIIDAESVEKEER